MALVGDPLVLQSGSHSALKFRQMLATLVAQNGVGGRDDCLVKQRVTPGQGVLVSTGGIFFKGTASSVQGVYSDFNDADADVPATAADGAQTRIDRVIYRVRDPVYDAGTPTGNFEWLAGSAGSGVPPTVPQDAISLAKVTRAANDNTIGNGEITDERLYAIGVGGLIICTSSTRPGTPRTGQAIYELDTFLAKVWNGSAWITTAPGARHRLHVYDSAIESIVNGQWVNMPFNTTVTDDDSGWDNVNRRYTIKQAGRWLFSACVRMNSGGSALNLALTKNRSIAGGTGDPDKWLYATTLGVLAQGTAMMDLAVNDQIYVPILNGYTASLNTVAGEVNEHFDAFFLG